MIIDYIKKHNSTFELIDRYPFLAEIKHDFGNFNEHVEELNRIFKQAIYKQSIAPQIAFDCSILEKYKDRFMRSIPVYASNVIIHQYVYQLNYDFIIAFMCFRSSLKDEPILAVPDFHATDLKKPYDFIMENLDLVVKHEEKKSLGFNQ